MILDAKDFLGSGEEKYKFLFSNLMSAFALHRIITDIFGKPIDYEFLEVNSSFEKMTGLKREDILGKRVTTVIPGIETDPADWIGRYGKVALEGKAIVFENYSDSLKRWFNISAYSPKKGYFVTIFEDISERKKIEEDVINSQNLLQRIIDLLPIRVFWKDKNLVYLGCNDIFAKDAGKNSSKDIVGKDDFQMTWKDQAKSYQDDDLSVINSREPKLNFEEVQTTPSGGKIWLKTSKLPLTDRQGNVIGILGTYEDITKRKISEEESLASSKSLQSKLNELEKFNKITIDRELKMVELKNRIKELERKLKDAGLS